MSYFNQERKDNALADLSIIYDCATKVGIREHVFIGFGLLLGIIRDCDFIGHDDDVDICVKADKITREQERDYFTMLEGKGMFEARRRIARRTDNGRMTWFSLRKKHDRSKFCHWLGFDYNGFWWHTKSGMWVKHPDFNKYAKNDCSAVMKGIPSLYVKDLMTYDFKGLIINIPKMYGSCLDFWYTGWRIPMKGISSDKKIICVIKEWKDQKTWRVQLT